MSQYHHFMYDTAEISEYGNLFAEYTEREEDDDGNDVERTARFVINCDEILGFHVHAADDNYSITVLLPGHYVMLTTDYEFQHSRLVDAMFEAVQG